VALEWVEAAAVAILYAQKKSRLVSKADFEAKFQAFHEITDALIEGAELTPDSVEDVDRLRAVVRALNITDDLEKAMMLWLDEHRRDTWRDVLAVLRQMPTEAERG
jgi:hypothetical protein